jgi:hypothetical protein
MHKAQSFVHVVTLFIRKPFIIPVMEPGTGFKGADKS